MKIDGDEFLAIAFTEADRGSKPKGEVCLEIVGRAMKGWRGCGGMIDGSITDVDDPGDDKWLGNGGCGSLVHSWMNKDIVHKA